MGQALTKNKKKGVQKFASEEYFLRNGGILLEKRIALTGRVVDGEVKILSQYEIKNATNNYDASLTTVNNSEARVYKVILDDREVFIKTSQDRGFNHELVDLFLTELSTSLVMCHDNMNKIYGCCLESNIPMIVYQCRSNKILHECLHGVGEFQKPMGWRNRLEVASGVAYALSYMHNVLSKPMVHRDVKSSSVLIDSSFHAILANVAHAVSITPGKKDQRWPVYGTPGYIDPEYVETREVTDKCDVYSFGVLMLELITMSDPIKMERCGKSLVIAFISEVERSGIKAIITRTVVEESSICEIQKFAQLALRCVAKKGDDRPSMISVTEELWQIQNNTTNI